MKFLSKGFTWILIITTIYTIFLISLFAYKTPDWTDLSKLFMSLGAGLIGWLITNAFAKLLDKNEKESERKTISSIEQLTLKHDEHITSIFPHHDETTRNILSIIKEKQIVLIKKERKDLKYDFYKSFFENATVIKISGIANKDFITDLLTIKDHELVKSLKDHNKNITVEILMSDPRAEHIRYRDIAEGNYAGIKYPSSSNIMKVIEGRIDTKNSDVNNFLKLEHSVLPGVNCLKIKMTKIPIYLPLTYIKYHNLKTSNSAKKEMMLLGVLFSQIIGEEMPIYEVSKVKNEESESLFTHALKEFNTIFIGSNSDFVINWDQNGLKYYDNIDKKIKEDLKQYWENNNK